MHEGPSYSLFDSLNLPQLTNRVQDINLLQEVIYMKIGIFYGSSTGNTETAAELISENFSEHDCSVQDVSSIEPDDLLGYDFLILGISTWYVGEAQDDWIDLLEDMDGMDFNGVKFAIFGQGDQLGYPDTFQD